MNLLQWIVEFLKRYFPDPEFHGALPSTTGGDEIFTPTISLESPTWLPWLTKPYEGQFYAFGDALDCTSQSGVHTIQAILNYFYKNNLFPVQAMNDLIKNNYLNVNGDVELSTPYIAKMCGTTRQGLRMDDFWNGANTHGMVPKKFWNKDTAKTWDEYYAEVPESIKTAGKEFAAIFQWNWKVILNDSWTAPSTVGVRSALAHSPIHFATCSCPRDGNGVMQYCGAKAYQHCRTLYSMDDYQEILDQYSPYLTKSSVGYPLGCAIVASLIIK